MLHYPINIIYPYRRAFLILLVLYLDVTLESNPQHSSKYLASPDLVIRPTTEKLCPNENLNFAQPKNIGIHNYVRL
jgi:hypothetical protein